MLEQPARSRIAEIQERARKRGPITLRCPHCRHHLVGILSPRGDFKHRNGERSNLFCCWPHCARKDQRVRAAKAIRGRGPRDGSSCCNKLRRSQAKAPSAK
jgi:hypothetical protein